MARTSVELAHYYPFRRHAVAKTAHPLARHQPIQQCGGLIAEAFCSLFNAAQRRSGERAYNFIVVYAEHGDVFRHPQSGRAAGFQDVPCPRVVCGQEPYRFFERLEPGRQFALQIRPFSCRGMARIDGTGNSRFFRPSCERLCPQRRPRFLGRVWIAAIGQSSKASLDQVFGAEPSDGSIIRGEIGYLQGKAAPATASFDADHRQAQSADDPDEVAIREREDNSVAGPLFQIGEFCQRLLFEIESPFPVFAA